MSANLYHCPIWRGQWPYSGDYLRYTKNFLRHLNVQYKTDLVFHPLNKQKIESLDTNNRISFSQNVHDESLPTSIQTMSCKLLLNLVECIKGRSEKENCINKGRELLMRMNEVFVLKFKTVAKMQLPVLMAKHKQAFQQVRSTNYLGFCTNVFA